jgi:hypothetical protein
MAITLSPLKWDQPLDPGDEVDYTFDLSGRLLEVGETVQTWNITLSDASIAAGLVLGSGDYAPSINGTVLKFWFSIDPARVADSAFDGIGVWLDMVVDITTTNTPPRVRNRTLLLRVCHQ